MEDYVENRGEIQPSPSLIERPPSNESQGTTGSEESVEFDRNRAGIVTVNCRVCDALIDLDGRTTQHVIKCSSCQEATPIRPAPIGKKYVRCPCNCLLICKAASTRIACPRTNCRRVITLGHREPQGSAVRAPTGSCRVSCVHCHEVFLFNTLTNSLANCPHCKNSSSVGGISVKRTKLWILATCVSAILTAFLFYPVLHSFGYENIIVVASAWIIWVGFIIATAACIAMVIKYKYYTKTSNVLGPI